VGNAMVANIRGYTPNYGFKLINFDTPRWHTLEYANWSQLDSMFLQFGASGIRGEWINSTEYLIGERVFDGTNGLIYRCLVQHTSRATGTFADDRTAHPTFWSLQLGGVPVFRGDWSPGSSYSTGDIVVVNEYEYFLCTTAHIAGGTFPGNGPEWQTIFDATEVVSDATDAADAAAGSASSAFTSANNAAASAAAADASADDAADSAFIASSSQGAFRWNFDINTAMADPGIADIQFNSANWSLTTLIAVSAQTADPGNPDVSDWVASWDDSTNPDQRGTLYIREASEPQNFVVFNIIGALTDNGTWLQVPVAFVTKLGAFSTGDALSVSFSRTGNTGASGAGSGDMLRANNLSDVQSVVTSRTNLGLGTTDTPQFTQVRVINQPSQDDHVATKQYVDGSASLIIADTPPSTVTTAAGALWWESDAGMLYVLYDDGDSKQWVQAVAIPSPNLAAYVAKSGDAMSGLLTLSGAPSADLHAATKLYADGKAAEAPVDARTYARRDLTWQEVPRYQRFPLGGVSSIDAQVPVGAKQARLTAMLYPTSIPTAVSLFMSVAPGVFRGTAGDYNLYGFANTASGATITNVNGSPMSYMHLASPNNAGQAIHVDALLTLVRPDASHFFGCKSTTSYFSGGDLLHAYYTNFMQNAAAGVALNILAFRFAGSFPWAADSYLHVEWL